jgi:hypothetical protein
VSICADCTQGAHCGPPGVASASCPCQHRPPGTWAGKRVAVHHVWPGVPPLVITSDEVETVACAVTRLSERAMEERALMDACTDECCPGDTCRLDAYRAEHGAVAASLVAAVHPDLVSPAEGQPRPFTSLLSEWLRKHRAGQFDQAKVLRTELITRLNRLGG